jgi:hypothetical protein
MLGHMERASGLRRWWLSFGLTAGFGACSAAPPSAAPDGSTVGAHPDAGDAGHAADPRPDASVKADAATTVMADAATTGTAGAGARDAAHVEDAATTHAADDDAAIDDAGTPSPKLSFGGLAPDAWLRAKCQRVLAPPGTFMPYGTPTAGCASKPPFASIAQARAQGCTARKSRATYDDFDADGVAVFAELREGMILCYGITDLSCPDGSTYHWVAPYGDVDGYHVRVTSSCNYTIDHFDPSPEEDPVNELNAACVVSTNWDVGPLMPSANPPSDCPSQPPFESPEQALSLGCTKVKPYTGIEPDDSNHDLVSVTANVVESGVACGIQRAFDCHGELWTWQGSRDADGLVSVGIAPTNAPAWRFCFSGTR